MKFGKIAILLIVALCISACSQGKPMPTEEPEVMMARDCGLDKLPCCQENPSCSFAQQCCVNPNNASENYCSDKCTCGSEKEFCCAGNKCNDGLACSNGRCQKCGGINEACCPGDKCSEGFGCLNNICAICGLSGNPCCAGNKCQGDGKFDQDRAECWDNNCQLCGYGGEPACKNGAKCSPKNLLNNDSCFLCGEYNQPCCQIGPDSAFDCNPEKGLKCELGFCAQK